MFDHIHRSIQEVILKLQKNIDNETEFNMNITRLNALQDALHYLDSESFDPRKKLNVGNNQTDLSLHKVVFT